MPPQGLLVIASVAAESGLAESDSSTRTSTRRSRGDFAWADAVFMSGMHVQRERMLDICARAHAAGKPAVLGGPSVSASPELYGDFDYLHIGEIGDATTELFALLARDCARPRAQVRFETRERLPLERFPVPAYELVSFNYYFIGSIQFSSGCPFTCEFCDIPGLYGRVPRMKRPEQIIAELDKLVACGLETSVYFVDDNFIANRRAVRELIPHLIAWQERKSFPLSFAFEATLNIAKYDDLLANLRDAKFTGIFCGIETPEPEEALRHMSKEQNTADGADPRRGRSAQFLWHRSDRRHDHRARHRQSRHAGARHGVHRAVQHPDADREPAAGAAAHPAVGPSQGREPAERGRAPRIERRVQDAL